MNECLFKFKEIDVELGREKITHATCIKCGRVVDCGVVYHRQLPAICQDTKTLMSIPLVPRLREMLSHAAYNKPTDEDVEATLSEIRELGKKLKTIETEAFKAGLERGRQDYTPLYQRENI